MTGIVYVEDNDRVVEEHHRDWDWSKDDPYRAMGIVVIDYIRASWESGDWPCLRDLLVEIFDEASPLYHDWTTEIAEEAMAKQIRNEAGYE